MELAGGGLASAIINYGCPPPPSWPRWGYETLRIFGENGFVESIDHGRIGTLAIVGRDPLPLMFNEPSKDFFRMFLEEIAGGKKVIPMTLDEELSPTRWIVRGKEALMRKKETA